MEDMGWGWRQGVGTNATGGMLFFASFIEITLLSNWDFLARCLFWIEMYLFNLNVGYVPCHKTGHVLRSRQTLLFLFSSLLPDAYLIESSFVDAELALRRHSVVYSSWSKQAFVCCFWSEKVYSLPFPSFFLPFMGLLFQPDCSLTHTKASWVKCNKILIECAHVLSDFLWNAILFSFLVCIIVL